MLRSLITLAGVAAAIPAPQVSQLPDGQVQAREYIPQVALISILRELSINLKL